MKNKDCNIFDLKSSKQLEWGRHFLSKYTELQEWNSKDRFLKDAMEGAKVHLIMESISACYALEVAARTKKIKDIDIPPAFYRTKSFLIGKTPKLRGPLSELLDGPRFRYGNNGMIAKVYAIKRFVRGKPLGSKQLYYKNIFNGTRTKEIISVKEDFSIASHAEDINERVALVYNGFWWHQNHDTNLNNKAFKNLKELSPIWSSYLLESVEKVDSLLGEIFKTYIEEIFLDSILNCLKWLNLMNEKTEGIGRELWIGSGGNIWHRLLALSYKRQGRTVVSHGHADGGAIKIGATPITDMSPATKYVVHNNYCKHAACESIKFWPLRRQEVKDIPIETLNVRKQNEIQLRVSSIDKKTLNILYVCTSYRYESLQLFPLTHVTDAKKIMRIVENEVHKLGHNLTFKPYPERERDLSIFFAQLSSCHTDQLFEEAIKDYDLLVFDEPCSTTFGAAISATNLPIILLDLPSMPWIHEARNILKTRCAIIEMESCELSENVHINKHKMQHLIEEAIDKRNDLMARSTLYLNTKYHL